MQVSVVMATYNRAAVVGQAIESILNQTLHDFEFIIVDDGSSDNTPEVLQTYAHRDKRIVVHRQTNQGLATARNAGVKQATGKHIAFMDDDDTSVVSRLERQLAFLKKHPDYSACICDFENSAIEYSPVHIHRVNPCWFYPVLGPTTMITKESFMACGGYRTSENVIEDLDFTFRFLEKFRMAVVNQELYCFRPPEKAESRSLSSKDPDQFMKRHIACYVNRWYRLKKQTDLIERGYSLGEILQLVPTLPWRIRYQIYRSLDHLLLTMMRANSCSKSEAQQIVMKIACIGRPLIVFGEAACEVFFYLRVVLIKLRIMRPGWYYRARPD